VRPREAHGARVLLQRRLDDLLGRLMQPAVDHLHARIPERTRDDLARPGQFTRIHDHATWCVLGVIQGVEHEELFNADLNLVGRNENHVGDVSGFAPPGDIHRVRNTGDTTAISIHVYGTDITRIGSSTRRYYD
jgi:hypothetical protein